MTDKLFTQIYTIVMSIIKLRIKPNSDSSAITEHDRVNPPYAERHYKVDKTLLYFLRIIYILLLTKNILNNICSHF